jgi:hypothetical protein
LDGPTRRLRVSTDAGFVRDFDVTAGDNSLPVPVKAGRTVISLLGLDAVTRPVQPNGDSRPMLVGIRAPQLSFRVGSSS